MSRVCSVCGKGRMTGNLVSHSNIKTKTFSAPNLHKVTVEEDGQVSKRYMCTKCMKGSKKDK